MLDNEEVLAHWGWGGVGAVAPREIKRNRLKWIIIKILFGLCGVILDVTW
jgi:hypothetical protein